MCRGNQPSTQRGARRMYMHVALNQSGTVVKRIKVADIARYADAVVTAIEHTPQLPVSLRPVRMRTTYSADSIFRRADTAPPRSYSSSTLRGRRDR
ncbi:MAG: hypothetical protein WA001_04775 [Patescibacteria group bacterium]